MNYQFDFSTLKPGDQVIFDTGNHYDPEYTLERVGRVTKTLIVLAGEAGLKFSRNGGGEFPRATGWSRACLEPVTPELLEKIERKNLIRFFSGDRVKSFSTAQLRAMKAAFKEASKQPEAQSQEGARHVSAM